MPADTPQNWSLHGQFVRLAKYHYDVPRESTALFRACEKLVAHWAALDPAYVIDQDVVQHVLDAWFNCWLPETTYVPRQKLRELIIPNRHLPKLVAELLSGLCILRVEQFPAPLPERLVDVLPLKADAVEAKA